MDVMSAALQGLEQAQSKVDQSAVRLSHLNAQDANGMPTDTVDLSQEMVSLITAHNDFSVNIAVLKTGDEMVRQAVNLLA